ncbi:MAG TPA: phosphatase PAP2 family protein [Polyangiaceae bacterium]|jgi:membrane-associated phospholipid phosphatase|nr:phosphatase PAP2 family protein [Polyangiaceae bacterium]
MAASRSANAEGHDLRWSPALDVAVLGAGGAAWGISEALKGALVPSTCRWCEPDAIDRGARDALRWDARSSAASASDWIAFGAAPASALVTLGLAMGHDRAPWHDVAQDAVLVGEATVLAMDLDQLAKFAVARERPFAYAPVPGEAVDPADPEDRVSFFSGHTTWTFALAASTGTVATLRGYRWAPFTWAIGGPLAAVTGYLRVAADKHWLTDVVTGAIVGAGIGILVPVAFHGRSSDGPPISPTSAAALGPAPVDAALSFPW